MKRLSDKLLWAGALIYVWLIPLLTLAEKKKRVGPSERFKGVRKYAEEKVEGGDDNTMMYVGIGVAVLVLLGLIFGRGKKKK